MASSLGIRAVSLVQIAALGVLFNTQICGLAGQTIPMDTIHGYVVVRNGEQGAWGSDQRWHIEESFRLGTALGGGPTSFGGGQLSIARTRNGDILVLDHQAKQIRVFDLRGEFLRQTGGPGQGPGEFQTPTGILIDPQDRLWVPDGFSGRYSIFESGGEFVRTVPRNLRGYNRRRQLRFIGEGGFIDHAAIGPDQARIGAAGFFHVDTTGAVLEAFPPIPYPHLPLKLLGPLTGSDDDPVRIAGRHLLPRLLWTLAPNGTLWFGYTDRLRLVNRTLDGDTLRIVETTHRRGRFTPSEEDIASRAARKTGGPSPFVPQVMQSIHVLDDGHILVQIAGELGKGGRTYDVFDPDGRFLGSIEAPFAMPPRTVPSWVGNTVIAVDTDEWDVPYIVSAVIHR